MLFLSLESFSFASLLISFAIFVVLRIIGIYCTRIIYMWACLLRLPVSLVFIPSNCRKWSFWASEEVFCDLGGAF